MRGGLEERVRIPSGIKGRGSHRRASILAVGASDTHNAEWFYLRALRAIGANVVFLDQYEDMSHGMLTRRALTKLPIVLSANSPEIAVRSHICRAR